MKKRGLPEGYVRGLEKLWGLAIRDVYDVEDNILSALAGDEESKPLSCLNVQDVLGFHDVSMPKKRNVLRCWMFEP